MKRIALPILCALIVVVGTIGIVLGSTILNRTINVTVVESVSISPSGASPVTIFKGEFVEVTYTIENPSNIAHTVTCSWDTLPTGITITLIPSTPVYVPPHDVTGPGIGLVTVRIAADDTAEASSSVVLHFTVT